MSTTRPPGALPWRQMLRLGPVAISSYVVMLYAGATAGVLLGAAVAGEAGLPQVRYAVAAIVLLIPGLLGSRLWFLVLNRLPIAAGGRAAGGSALLGGLVVMVACSPLVLRLAGLPFRAFWDVGTVTLLTGLVLTRVGCTLHGCCLGRGCAHGLLMPDSRGRWGRRVPVQPIEMAWGSSALVVVLLLLPHTTHPGVIFAGVLTGYAALRLATEPLRAEPSTRVRRTNVVVEAVLLLAGTAGLALALTT